MSLQDISIFWNVNLSLPFYRKWAGWTGRDFDAILIAIKTQITALGESSIKVGLINVNRADHKCIFAYWPLVQLLSFETVSVLHYFSLEMVAKRNVFKVKMDDSLAQRSLAVLSKLSMLRSRAITNSKAARSLGERQLRNRRFLAASPPRARDPRGFASASCFHQTEKPNRQYAG